MKTTRLSVPVIIRYAIAVVGAVSITIALLLFMNNLVGRFLLEDPTRYFAITNYYPAPDRGRQLPDAPASPAVAPEAPKLDYESTEDVLIEVPVVEVDTTVPIVEQRPNLED